MKVEEIATLSPRACSPEANLAHAASIMWNQDCGIVPVVDAEDRIVGILTDRDIALALVARHRLAVDVTVREAMSPQVWTCRLEDDVQTALATMAARRVRRLAVADGEGKLKGILSLHDVILHAEERGAPSCGDVVAALRAIGRPAARTEAA